jgi:transposase
MSEKRHRVRLSKAVHQKLVRFVNTGKGKARTITRARILLMTDEGPRRKGKSDKHIAEALHISLSFVESTRRRYCLSGLGTALHDRPRSGQPRRLSGRQEAQLTALACATPPAGHIAWTLRLLADQLVELKIVDRISHETVRQVLKKTI